MSEAKTKNIAEVVARAETGWDFGKGRQKHRSPNSQRQRLPLLTLVCFQVGTLERERLCQCFSNGITERIKTLKGFGKNKVTFINLYNHPELLYKY